jgi:hypothetical protein
LEKASENIAAVSNIRPGKELSCDTKDVVRSDEHLATHYSFERATALLEVRNAGNEDVEDEGEEGGEETAREQDISMKIRAYEQALHGMGEVMQFTIDSNSSSLPELLYTVKDCSKKDMDTKKRKQVFLLNL